MKKNVKALPHDIQERLKNLLPFLSIDPFHQYLHTKPLKEQWKGYLSFRITRNYRVIFKIAEDVITLSAVDHRKDVYR